MKLSALLHDIGKLGYRAGENGNHSEIGEMIIKSYFPKELQTICGLISGHHKNELYLNPEGYKLLKIIVLSDWLSSSERIVSVEREQKKDVKGIPLQSVFSKIKIYKATKKLRNTYYYGKPLKLNEVIFSKAKIDDDVLKDDFKKNWEIFLIGLEMLSNYQELEFDYLFNLIEKHFKLVPSAAYMDIPDISLFDHSKTVCAISLSLFHQPNVDLNFLNNALDIFFKIFKTEEDFKKKLGISHLSKEIKEKEVYSQLTDNENNIMREEIFSLIHGDLSGIQDFIYSISTKHAMKTLKGRSLFISLLMDLIADWTVEELELSKANILFSGGGHFYILSHADIKEKVVGIRIKLNELMLKYFDTKLYFALDFIPLSCKELRDEISDKWKNVGEKTSKWKSKKFYELLEKEKSYKEVIFPEEREHGHGKICSICGSEGDLEPIQESEDKQWCKYCRGFKKLAEDLKDSKYFLAKGYQENDYNFFFNEIGRGISFSKSSQKDMYIINSTEMKDNIGFKLIPKGLPLDEDGNIVDLDNLGKGAEKRTGTNKIGILKMDVDSLGNIFKRGLEDNISISRLSTLSSSLSIFFKGYISKYIEEDKEKGYKDSIYLVYAGGDDTFAVGSWDEIIEFSYDIYKKFREYTAFNPDITISAGISIMSPKFPIYRAADLVEDELEKVKNYEKPNNKYNTKNKISIFGTVLKWDWSENGKIVKIYDVKKELEITNKDNEIEIDKNKLKEYLKNTTEFDLTHFIKDILVHLIKEKNVPRGILQKLANSVKGMKPLLENSSKGKIDVPKLWRLKYWLRKQMSDKKDKEIQFYRKLICEIYEIVIKKNLFEQDENFKIKNVDFISAGVKWADLLTRRKKEVMV